MVKKSIFWLFKEVVIIGKIIILSLSDSEECVIDRLKDLIENARGIEYTEINPKSELFFKDIKIHLKKQEVYRKDKLVLLSKQEFLTLRFLTEHPGWVCTKKQIYDAVYEGKFKEDIDNIIYCLISSLRRKLETDSRHPEYIQTVRGAGINM